MEGRQRAAQVHADAGDFACAHGAAVAHDVGQGLPLDVLHPDADPVLVLIGAIDDDYVRVADACERTGLLQRGRRNIARRQELDCDLPVHQGIPPAVHGSEGARADAFEQDQMAPVARDESRGSDC